MTWTQPVCGPCWIVRSGGQVPTRLKIAELERCCRCGNETRSGIYIRVDPASVPYPRTDPDESSAGA